MTATSAPRIAVVTGAASGIGLATAAFLIGEGWRVVVLDLEGAPLQEARERHRNDPVVCEAIDVTDEPMVEALVARIEREVGPIDGVVNCAGIARDIPTLDHPVDVFRKILDVNVVGSFIVGRAVARHMAARNHGAIVNIASISGLRGSKGRAAYGASKGAVVTMTKVMAVDLAEHGIRVNAVAPGPVETPMVKAVHSEADRKLYDRFVPMRRYAAPEEIASVIAFLLDERRSSYMTAEVVAVDGGFTGAGIFDRS